VGRPISVRGGTNGVVAHYDDMTAAARLFARAGGDVAAASVALHGYLIGPDVLASAPLDPVGAARFEATLMAALDGPRGLTWLAARCAATDLGLRAAAAAYLGADRLDERVEPELDAVARAPKAILDAAVRLSGGDPGGALQKLITDDPQLADLGIGVAGDVLGAGSVAAGARLVGLPFADGMPSSPTLAVTRGPGRRAASKTCSRASPGATRGGPARSTCTSSTAAARTRARSSSTSLAPRTGRSPCTAATSRASPRTCALCVVR